MSEPDFNERKARTVERHQQNTERFLQRLQNLEEKKLRGDRRQRRPSAEEDEGGWEDEYARPPHRRSSKPSLPPSSPRAVATVRVANVSRTEIAVLTDAGERHRAILTPRVLALGGVVVGDLVGLDAEGRVVSRGERDSLLSRKSPGSHHVSRPMAANVDIGLVLIPSKPCGGLSLGFLDRAALAFESGGIEAIAVLTKVDLLPSDAARDEAWAYLQAWLNAGRQAFAVSSVTGDGVDDLFDAIRGQVTVLIGHSGAGKSTLVNALDPDASQLTGHVRDSDGKGRHTTTASELIPFAEGGALVDTPGIRGLVPDFAGVDDAARSIPELLPWLGECHFSDCAHVGEPGCAVAEAAADDPSVMNALSRLHRLIDSMTS